MIQPLLIPTAAEKRIDTDFYVEGYATTFDKPYLLYEWDGNKYYERIDRNALAGADMSDVIMQYNHEGKVLARLSNGTLGVEANDNGLFTFADLSKSRAAQDMFEEIKNGLVTKMSWAFRVSEDSYDRDTRTRTILKIAKVYDVSAVSIRIIQTCVFILPILQTATLLWPFVRKLSLPFLDIRWISIIFH